MPHAERIRARDTQVAAAAWRLILKDGDDSLTMRAIAAEAGVAQTSMIYTLPTLTAVRERALLLVGDSIRGRIDALDAESTATIYGPERARELLHALLPLDEERYDVATVMVALSAGAPAHPELLLAWREVDGVIRDICAQALRAVGISGDVVQLDHLHALVDGLVAQLVKRGADRSPAWALAVLERELERMTS